MKALELVLLLYKELRLILARRQRINVHKINIFFRVLNPLSPNILEWFFDFGMLYWQRVLRENVNCIHMDCQILYKSSLGHGAVNYKLMYSSWQKAAKV